MKKKYRIIRYTGFLAAVGMVVSLVAFLVCSMCGSAFANTVATVVDNSGYYVSISSNDIAMNMAASGVRIEAPIPNKAAVGIEVPNKERQFVQLGCMLSGDTFVNAKSSSLMFTMGKDVANRKVYGDEGTEVKHI